MRGDDEFDRLVAEIPDPDYDELTVTEQQIIDIVMQGETDASIAKQLQIPEKTVQRHVAMIYKKMYTWKKGVGPSRPFPKPD